MIRTILLLLLGGLAFMAFAIASGVLMLGLYWCTGVPISGVSQ